MHPRALQSLVESLADDRMEGRHALHPAIWDAAERLSEAYQRHGIPSFGASFLRTFTAPSGEPREVPNVLAYLPGHDLAHEVIVVGAHFDHLGRSDHPEMNCPSGRPEASPDPICNGADDNASGCAVVVELARALAASNRPRRRSILFAHFAGEELGLWGSEALARELLGPPQASPGPSTHPLRVVAMLNFDMVGRLRSEGMVLGGLSSSSAWLPLLDEIDRRDPKGRYPPRVYDRSINTRSDHVSFYRRGVPVLFFFTRLHDDYHGPLDHADQLNYEGMSRIGQFAARIVEDLTDGRALPFTAPESASEGLVSAIPGSTPSTLVRHHGVDEGRF